MRKRVLLAALAAGALLVAPVAGTDAKPDGAGGTAKSKCDKTKLVGFKVRGTFDGYVAPDLTIAVDHFNRHAGDWLEAGNVPSFNTTGARIKFIGLTDDVAPVGVGFEDAVETDRVKLKAKLEKLKHGCEDAAALEVSSDLVVKKVKVKRPDATETD